MNPAELGTILQGMDLFHEFNEHEMEAFLSLVEPVQFATGETVVKQDDHGDCMFLIVGGTARVVHRRDGRYIELSVLKCGDFFGELALVDAGPRSADVIALEDCSLLRLSQAVIRALAGVYPSAAFKLLISVGRVMVARLRAGNQKYIDSILLCAPAKD